MSFPTPVTLNGAATFEVKADVAGTVNSTNTETINVRIMQGASTNYTAYSSAGAVDPAATVVR